MSDIYTAIASMILSGIGSNSKAKKDKKQSEEDRKQELEMQRRAGLGSERLQRVSGDEARRTAAYGAGLEDFYRKKGRKEKSDAWSGYFGPKTVHNDNVQPSLEQYYVDVPNPYAPLPEEGTG
jgi:hypothetical protein